MRKVIFLCVLTVILSCSNDSDSVVEGEDNVFIVLNFPADPLVESITSYKVTTTAIDIISPLNESASISPNSGQTDTISAYVSSGTDRKITLHFYSQNGGLIFWGQVLATVAEEETTEILVDIMQAAAGSASRVKIFRDNLPWNSEALDDVLAEIGLTLGTGENQYQVVSSSALDTVSLTTGQDLVIVANDQSQEFYNNYYASQAKIDAFVSDGGTILWEACDLGWARGSIEQAGITLPGDIEIVSGYEFYNYLTSSLWKLTSNLDSTLYGTYASHEGFINLPDGAVVYTIDSRNLPTLLSFNYGIGWVIISGQPLEYLYDRADSLNTGLLLRNIIGFVLGLPGAESPPLVKRNRNTDESFRNSSGFD